MNNDRLRELQRKCAEDKRERDREISLNPLSQYSTTQLKQELKRRKNNRFLYK